MHRADAGTEPARAGLDFVLQSKLTLQYKANDGRTAGRDKGADMSDGADAGEGTTMDVQEAAVIMQEAGERAQREFRPSHRASFITWGVILLLGYGTMWLNVRGQHPFHGPNPGAFAAVTLLASGSALAVVAQSRAESGVSGASALRRRIHSCRSSPDSPGCSSWKARCTGPAPAGP